MSQLITRLLCCDDVVTGSPARVSPTFPYLSNINASFLSSISVSRILVRRSMFVGFACDFELLLLVVLVLSMMCRCWHRMTMLVITSPHTQACMLVWKPSKFPAAKLRVQASPTLTSPRRAGGEALHVATSCSVRLGFQVPLQTETTSRPM